MKISDYSFDLPKEQIAQYPPEERGTANLMVIDRLDGSIEHKNMQNFTDYIDDNTVVVFNNSRVRKARLFATTDDSGGKVEFFMLSKTEKNQWEVMVSKAKKQVVGRSYTFEGGAKGRITRIISTNHRIVEFDTDINDDYLDQYAHIPLPPYIKRGDDNADSERYQTVFSKEIGSCAAPTASLHFTQDILDKIKEKGADIAFVTLHVGLGTFAPVRTEYLDDHDMHYEDFYISDESATIIENAKKAGKKILAVGTTSVRTLESSWVDGKLLRGTRSTNLFIKPGYEFKVVDRMFTNFHTPESTLLVLVSTFATKTLIDKAYKEAVDSDYMFFSYGDAMLIM
ncbi:tRNA preQ1(34) S-adenosylmethionine ribosyltransferase-isomerase QueA [Thiospirochaeta perfilievii]|uniref:S-adenosylmethionine:tRNA ribosyltransferase-isomerase n=1 Tax=Thiospirochaeta perfilievii TaxID=252967 RepID=A0A5C1QAV1_9SPIO|nr:tRNA preQ1(34) S-adenosylmethionine ribosyltransferase-isomerase QueA [Thiospirochaeta perfilievii]QEN03282.1 tRNA preQ1(34) S-adenosylmethionine ribosyltransferase-isomerase QueA [Thiospirochaeta perfilievii]